MRSNVKSKVLGTDEMTTNMQRETKRVDEELQIYDSSTVKVEHMTHGIRLHAKSITSVQQQQVLTWLP